MSTNKAATIGKVRANGTTYQMWTTTDHGGKNHEALLKNAVKDDKVSDPGTYIVCSFNTAGMPVGSVFTVRRSGDDLVIDPGVPHVGRVHRWPPKP